MENALNPQITEAGLVKMPKISENHVLRVVITILLWVAAKVLFMKDKKLDHNYYSALLDFVVLYFFISINVSNMKQVHMLGIAFIGSLVINAVIYMYNNRSILNKNGTVKNKINPMPKSILKKPDKQGKQGKSRRSRKSGRSDKVARVRLLEDSDEMQQDPEYEEEPDLRSYIESRENSNPDSQSMVRRSTAGRRSDKSSRQNMDEVSGISNISELQNEENEYDEPLGLDNGGSYELL
jgi:hypothetical protein